VEEVDGYALVAHAELSSRASMPSLDYDAAPVRVALYGYDGAR